ncbi:MAG TPA: hypothetical protein VFF59_11490, partial [Anaerolineae bacterium]|nr:hypothetical protein [Anaerolineae bacterium]
MIGTLRETDLHAALKRHYARPLDQLEANVDGYVVDILRDDIGLELIDRAGVVPLERRMQIGFAQSPDHRPHSHQ